MKLRDLDDLGSVGGDTYLLGSRDLKRDLDGVADERLPRGSASSCQGFPWSPGGPG